MWPSFSMLAVTCLTYQSYSPCCVMFRLSLTLKTIVQLNNFPRNKITNYSNIGLHENQNVAKWIQINFQIKIPTRQEENQLTALRQRPKHGRVSEQQSHPSVEKEYRSTQNVYIHSKCTCWISLIKFYNQISTDPDESIQPCSYQYSGHVCHCGLVT